MIERYGAEHGLAQGGSTVIALADKVYVSVIGKTAVFDPATKRFVPDTTFDVVERDEDSGFINFIEGPDGRIYVSSGRDAAVMTRQADGTYTTDRQLFSRFSADRTGAFYAEKNGVLWFGTGGLLARFDTTKFERSTPPFSALIRRITVNQSSPVSPSPAGDAAPSLAAGSRSIRFEFAAPSFLNERTTEYQSRLDGLDPDWSAGRASRGATTRTWGSATTASTCGRAT